MLISGGGFEGGGAEADEVEIRDPGRHGGANGGENVRGVLFEFGQQGCCREHEHAGIPEIAARLQEFDGFLGVRLFDEAVEFEDAFELGHCGTLGNVAIGRFQARWAACRR